MYVFLLVKSSGEIKVKSEAIKSIGYITICTQGNSNLNLSKYMFFATI